MNPTQACSKEKVCGQLEGGTAALVCASGQQCGRSWIGVFTPSCSRGDQLHRRQRQLYGGSGQPARGSRDEIMPDEGPYLMLVDGLG